MRRARAGVALLAGVLLLALVAGGLLIARDQTQQRRALTARFDSRQATASRFIEAYLNEIVENERTLAAREFTGPVTMEGFAETAAEHGFAAAVLLDPSGRLLASHPADAGAVGRDMMLPQYAHLRAAVAGSPTVSNIVPSAVQRKPVVAFALPFETPSGRRVFSGAYAISETPLAPFVRNALPFRAAHVMLVDGAGVIVASNIAEDAGRSLAETDAAFAGIGSDRGFVESHGRTHYVARGPVTDSPWQLVFAVETQELFGPLNGSGRLIPWFTLLTLGIAGLLSTVLVYRYRLQSGLLIDSELRHRTIIDTASDAFIAMNERGQISDWNAAATRLFGWTDDQVLGRSLADLLVPVEHRQALTDGLASFLRTGQPVLPSVAVRVAALTSSGECVDVELRLSRMRWGSGWHFHAFLRDISETLVHEAQLRDLALTDSLTGLANRRAAINRISQALSRADRRKNPIAVVFIDIDRFKAVNDRYGHAAGDALLVQVAERLRATYRNEDTVARLGGDEFLVVCEDLTAQADAKLLVERTRQALALPYSFNGETLNVTASVGHALGDGTTSVEALLDYADAEMYEAKASQQVFSALVELKKG